MAVAALALAPAQSAGAQSRHSPAIDPYVETIQRTRQLLVELAFDPDLFFSDEGFGRNSVNIAYSGDIEGWPVFALAIRQGCLRHHPSGRDCPNRRTARMVRAPSVPDQSRPRMRGFALARRVIESGARNRSAVAAELARGEPEWLEADLADCPAAAALLREADRIAWVPEEIYAPTAGLPAPPAMHADSVEVTFATFRGRSTHTGIIEGSTPAAWAVRLAEALEPCWRPATTTPPWRR